MPDRSTINQAHTYIKIHIKSNSSKAVLTIKAAKTKLKIIQLNNVEKLNMGKSNLWSTIKKNREYGGIKYGTEVSANKPAGQALPYQFVRN